MKRILLSLCACLIMPFLCGAQDNQLYSTVQTNGQIIFPIEDTFFGLKLNQTYPEKKLRSALSKSGYQYIGAGEQDMSKQMFSNEKIYRFSHGKQWSTIDLMVSDGQLKAIQFIKYHKLDISCEQEYERIRTSFVEEYGETETAENAKVFYRALGKNNIGLCLFRKPDSISLIYVYVSEGDVERLGFGMHN